MRDALRNDPLDLIAEVQPIAAAMAADHGSVQSAIEAGDERTSEYRRLIMELEKVCGGKPWI